MMLEQGHLSLIFWVQRAAGTQQQDCKAFILEAAQSHLTHDGS